jgi:hypothetical protein
MAKQTTKFTIPEHASKPLKKLLTQIDKKLNDHHITVITDSMIIRIEYVSMKNPKNKGFYELNNWEDVQL